jgi:sterol desaturase/sphingolipid hydroxylase (fatty acid hydroxylase superfamily)
MKKLNVSEKGNSRIFKQSFLEVFTRTSPAISFFYYGFIIGVFIYLNVRFTANSLLKSTVLYVAALFFWSFFEYIMHRYVFHFTNGTGWSKRLHYIIHGVHHQSPRDEERLFMPPLPGTLIIAVLCGFFYLLLGTDAFIWMAGFLNGWGIYVSIHYIVHMYQPVAPFKMLWTHHAKHHYKDEHKAFGVSSPLWDYIFRTMP